MKKEQIKKSQLVKKKPKNAVQMKKKAAKLLAAAVGSIGIYAIYKKITSQKLEVFNNISQEKVYEIALKGRNIKLSDSDITKITLHVVCAGVQLDLSNIEMKEDILIEIYNFCGGVLLRVPKQVQIKREETLILSKCSNQIPKYHEKNLPTIYIKVKSIFGGIGIRTEEKEEKKSVQIWKEEEESFDAMLITGEKENN